MTIFKNNFVFFLRELGEQVANEIKELLPRKKRDSPHQVKEQVLLVSRGEPYDYHVNIFLPTFCWIFF